VFADIVLPQLIIKKTVKFIIVESAKLVPNMGVLLMAFLGGDKLDTKKNLCVKNVGINQNTQNSSMCFMLTEI